MSFQDILNRANERSHFIASLDDPVLREIIKAYVELGDVYDFQSYTSNRTFTAVFFLKAGDALLDISIKQADGKWIIRHIVGDNDESFVFTQSQVTDFFVNRKPLKEFESYVNIIARSLDERPFEYMTIRYPKEKAESSLLRYLVCQRMASCIDGNLSAFLQKAGYIIEQEGNGFYAVKQSEGGNITLSGDVHQKGYGRSILMTAYIRPEGAENDVMVEMREYENLTASKLYAVADFIYSVETNPLLVPNLLKHSSPGV